MWEDRRTLTDNIGDHSLGVKEVTSMFGHFIKYRVRAEQVQEWVRQPASMIAFDVLMRAQRQLQSLCHPLRFHPETRKMNCILKAIKARGLQWDSSEVHSGAAKRTIGIRIVYTRKESCCVQIYSTCSGQCLSPSLFYLIPLQILRDVPWYIDGSHSTLEEREYGVPTLLQKFQG